MYDFAQNRQKLGRIRDKMPNASEEQIKAEYIRNGGLLNKEERPLVDVSVVGGTPSNGTSTKKSVAKVVVKKPVAKKAAKKVVKKPIKKVVKKVAKKVAKRA